MKLRDNPRLSLIAFGAAGPKTYVYIFAIEETSSDFF